MSYSPFIYPLFSEKRTPPILPINEIFIFIFVMHSIFLRDIKNEFLIDFHNFSNFLLP